MTDQLPMVILSTDTNYILVNIVKLNCLSFLLDFVAQGGDPSGTGQGEVMGLEI